MRLLAVLALAAAGAQADDVVVKVMSFNIRTSYASGDAAARCSNWAGERKGNVASQISTVGPDFVGTQETSDEQKAFLDDNLKASYKSIGTSTGSLNGAASEVNAIYYKSTDWELIKQGMYWFGPNPDAPSAAWGMVYYRTFVYGRFKHLKSGNTVCILNTHYETPGNDLAQNEASKIIIAKTPAICSGDDKITVLTGDFNAKRNYQAIQTLFADNWLETNEDPTFCGDMISPTCQEKFDFTFHKLSSGTCQTKTEVIRQNFSGCYPSDHAVIMGSYCISGSCCGAPETTQPPSSGSNSTGGSSLGNPSSSGSGANESDLKPGVVIPQGGSGVILTSGGGATGGGGVGGGAATGGGGTSADTIGAEGVNKASSGDGATATGGDSVQQANTKSETSTNATGTVFAIMGVLAAVGVVCAFVIKKKRALEAQLDDQKSGLEPAPSFISRAEQDALSPQRQTSSSNRGTNYIRAMARKFSSPVPTLETINEEDRKRSFSQTSSIPCSHRASVPLTPDDYNSSLDRGSSPVMLDDDGRETARGSSRLYFSEVGTERTVNKNRSDFALL